MEGAVVPLGIGPSSHHERDLLTRRDRAYEPRPSGCGTPSPTLPHGRGSSEGGRSALVPGQFHRPDFAGLAAAIDTQRTLDRQPQDKLAALPWFAVEQDVAAVLAQDLAADGQTQARPLRP